MTSMENFNKNWSGSIDAPGCIPSSPGRSTLCLQINPFLGSDQPILHARSQDTFLTNVCEDAILILSLIPSLINQRMLNWRSKQQHSAAMSLAVFALQYVQLDDRSPPGIWSLMVLKALSGQTWKIKDFQWLTRISISWVLLQRSISRTSWLVYIFF